MKKYFVAFGVLSVVLLSVLVVQGAEEASWGKIKQQLKGDNSLEPAAKKATKVDICHYDADADLFKVINISGNAVDKHVKNHGDVSPSTFYADADGDGYGDPNGATDACPNTGFVDNDDDCDDTNAAINPGAEEVCGDGIDNNCDGVDDACVGCVDILHACSSGSWSMQRVCGAGDHTLTPFARDNASYILFGPNVNGVILTQDGTGATTTITSSTNLCSLPGGCCSAGRWNDEIASVSLF